MKNKLKSENACCYYSAQNRFSLCVLSNESVKKDNILFKDMLYYFAYFLCFGVYLLLIKICCTL